MGTINDCRATVQAAAARHKVAVIPGTRISAGLRDIPTLNINGTLDDYFLALGLLGAALAFVTDVTFDGDDLLIEVDSDEDYTGDPDQIDLRKLPAFRKFERYIGETSGCVLVTFVGGVVYTHFVNEQWHVDFQNALDEQREAIEAAGDTLSKERKLSESSAKAALTRKFRSLREDATIRSLVAKKTTIRALVTYVREEHFADEDIDERTLKDRVTELRDLLLAQTG